VERWVAYLGRRDGLVRHRRDEHTDDATVLHLEAGHWLLIAKPALTPEVGQLGRAADAWLMSSLRERRADPQPISSVIAGAAGEDHDHQRWPHARSRVPHHELGSGIQDSGDGVVAADLSLA